MTEDPPAQRRDNVAGGKYRAGGSGKEESADEITEWGREETDALSNSALGATFGAGTRTGAG